MSLTPPVTPPRSTAAVEEDMIHQPHVERQYNRISQVNDAAIGQNKSHHEELFIETCIHKLLTVNHESGGGIDSDLISQTEYAAFIIQYCRGAEDVRGRECSNALYFFKDLPNEIQVEFLRHSEEACPFDIIDSDDSALQDCLDELNAEGGLFYVGAGNVSSLCASTFGLMIYTDLLLNSTTFPATQAPLSTAKPTAVAISPTSAPMNILRSQQPTIGQNQDYESQNGLSSVGILGIVMTALFVTIFLIHCILLHLRKHDSKKSQLVNDIIALREDESVVASEHSHDLLSPIATMDVAVSSTAPKHRDHAFDISLTPTDDIGLQSTKASGSRLIRAKLKGVDRQGFAKSKAYHGHKSSGNSHPVQPTHKHLHPHPLITENLSDGNPVHVRKRFHKKLAGSFSFDEDDINGVGDTFNNDEGSKVTPAIPLLQLGKENNIAASRNVQVESTDSPRKQATTTATYEVRHESSVRSSALFRERA